MHYTPAKEAADTGTGTGTGPSSSSSSSNPTLESFVVSYEQCGVAVLDELVPENTLTELRELVVRKPVDYQRQSLKRLLATMATTMMRLIKDALLHHFNV